METQTSCPLPLVSVIMAVYNGEKYLADTVKSILEQNYQNIELIIVDDASTDSTPELLRRITDPRVVVYTNPQNRKLAASLNFAIARSHGIYIARMDADDLCDSDRIIKQVAYMESHPDTDVLGGNYRACGNAHYKSDYKTGHDYIRTGLLFENTMCHPAVFFRKDAISSWYDETFAASQDYDLWTRLIDTNRFANLKDIVLHYRVHEGQTLKTASAAQKKGAELSRLRMLEKYGITDRVHTKNFLEFCSLPAETTYTQYLDLCNSVTYVREHAIALNKRIYDYYASRCAWRNVLRLRKSGYYRKVFIYTLLHFPKALASDIRLTYLVIRSMLK